MINWRLNRFGKILLFRLKRNMRLIWQYTSIRAKGLYMLNCIYVRSACFPAPSNYSSVTKTWQAREVAFVRQTMRPTDQDPGSGGAEGRGRRRCIKISNTMCLKRAMCKTWFSLSILWKEFFFCNVDLSSVWLNKFCFLVINWESTFQK